MATATTAARPLRCTAHGGAAALLLVVLLAINSISSSHAFVVPLRPPTTSSRIRPSPSSSSRLHMTASNGPSPLAATQRALFTASALLLGSGSLAPLSPPPVAGAADLSTLPSEVQEAFKKAHNSVDPFLLRDAIKQLSEYEGLDELAFDDTARRAVNTELKELQREKPELWEAETSYYGGVVRRAVNPFHVIELIPLLKAGPIIGGIGYVVAILVQRKFPSLFALAYFGAVASLVLPAVFLILNT